MIETPVPFKSKESLTMLTQDEIQNLLQVLQWIMNYKTEVVECIIDGYDDDSEGIYTEVDYLYEKAIPPLIDRLNEMILSVHVNKIKRDILYRYNHINHQQLKTVLKSIIEDL